MHLCAHMSLFVLIVVRTVDVRNEIPDIVWTLVDNCKRFLLVNFIVFYVIDGYEELICSADM